MTTADAEAASENGVGLQRMPRGPGCYFISLYVCLYFTTSLWFCREHTDLGADSDDPGHPGPRGRHVLPLDVPVTQTGY